MTTLAATQAEAQSLCSDYTVARGDTLSGIAGRAGVRGGYQFLFNANSNVLTSPNLLVVGQVIAIPCADGSLASAASTAPAQVAPAVVRVEALDRPLRIVTASGYAPFTDEALPEGGAITQMVRRSMEIGNPDQDYSLMFVNDWGSHLSELLPSGAFDMAFPWFKPDCDAVENLSEANAYRCTDFIHSDPFYDAVVGWYTLAGSQYDGAADYETLYGATICRPEAWFTFDMEAAKMVEPNITFVTGAVEEDCWAMLRDGKADVVTYDALPAEEDYTEFGMDGQVATLDNLNSNATLHVFVSKNNPNGEQYLEILNAGLQDLRLSGEWFEIVRAQVQETKMN